MPDTPDPQTAAEGTPLIYAALSAVQAELGRFEKTGRGPSSQGSYPFLPVDTIVATISPLFVKHGVIVIPRTEHATQEVERFPKVNLEGQVVHDGRATPFQALTLIRYEFDFVSVVDGSKVTAVAYGESADSGDKGVRRAATAAYKEVLLRTFTIVSGDEDPDAADPNETEPVIARQDRGAQARERAARPAREATERPARAPRERAARPTAEPTAEATAERADAAAAAAPEPEETPAAPETVTEAKAQQQEQTWKPDPEDVAAAVEQNEAAKAAAEAPTRRPAARQRPTAPTVETRQPETKAEERAESVADARAAIRQALAERGLDRDYVNALGDEITGKERGQWFANLSDLNKVLAAIRAGEAPAEAESGF